MSTKENVQNLQTRLNELLAQRAQIDEQVLGIRNTIAGVNLGVELQKEIVAEASVPQAEEGDDS